MYNLKLTDSIIFIVGVGRSGTSLLQSMLNAHSQIAFIPEVDFIRRFLATQKMEIILAKKGHNCLIDFLAKDRLILRLGLDITKTFKDFTFNGNQISLMVYKQLLASYLLREQKQIIGDKDPRSIEFLPLIKKLFPDAYIIHAIRDPRDVLLSKMKANWSKSRPYFLHILVNKIQLHLGLKYAALFPEKYLEIHYEKLLSNPVETLKVICNHIGVEFDEAMLEFSTSSKKLVFKDELQWKKETLGPLIKSNTNKWKKQLTKWQIILTEMNVDIAFKQYGYKKSSQHLNLAEKIIANASRFFYNTAMILYLLKKAI